MKHTTRGICAAIGYSPFCFPRVIDGVKCVGYDGFVDLVTEHSVNQSWL